MKRAANSSQNHNKEIPGITLEEDEHIELSLHCSRIIPILTWAGAALALILLAVLSTALSSIGGSGAVAMDSFSSTIISFVMLIIMGVIALSALVSTYTYNGNHLYITNQRVIQQSRTSLFSASTNIIDFASIEDVSYKQEGIIDHLLGIGTLRMSTVGDETTYTFKNVDTPNSELKVITHLVHAAKEDKKD